MHPALNENAHGVCLFYSAIDSPSFLLLFWALQLLFAGTSHAPFQTLHPKIVQVNILLFILTSVISQLLNKHFPQGIFPWWKQHEAERYFLHVSKYFESYGETKLSHMTFLLQQETLTTYTELNDCLYRWCGAVQNLLSNKLLACATSLQFLFPLREQTE